MRFHQDHVSDLLDEKQDGTQGRAHLVAHRRCKVLCLHRLDVLLQKLHLADLVLGLFGGVI